MTNCDQSKYRSQTLYWDDRQFKAYHPDTISYSVNTENIVTGKSITWDNGQFHSVQNLTNYSYSIEYQPLTCKSYRVESRAISRTVVTNCSPYTTSTQQINGNWANQGSYRRPSLTRIRQPSTIVCGSTQNYNDILSILYFTNTTCTTTTTTTRTIFTSNVSSVYETRLIDLDTNQEPPKQIIINDGGVISTYPINNPNSVQVNDQVTEIKKIIVNGNEFDLDDENSIDLVCTDPIPQCPSDTIECDCGDGVIWCLKKQGDIYKLIDCIYY